LDKVTVQSCTDTWANHPDSYWVGTPHQHLCRNITIFAKPKTTGKIVTITTDKENEKHVALDFGIDCTLAHQLRTD
jgi:hypothetical protein